jgi:hypothetical protein
MSKLLSLVAGRRTSRASFAWHAHSGCPPSNTPSKLESDANQIAKQTPTIFRGDAKQNMDPKAQTGMSVPPGGTDIPVCAFPILATTLPFSPNTMAKPSNKVNRLTIKELWRQKSQKPTTLPRFWGAGWHWRSGEIRSDNSVFIPTVFCGFLAAGRLSLTLLYLTFVLSWNRPGRRTSCCTIG